VKGDNRVPMQKIDNRAVGFLLAFCILGSVSDANAVTGFLKSESLQGLSKVCFYDVLGETHTVNIPSTKVCPVNHQFEAIPQEPAKPPAVGKTGFFKREQEQGLTKICYYDVIGETHMITIGAVKVCPPTHTFN
jgi:hypothetical protein